jgi:hypothetical protein
MSLTFENENDVIVYALQKIIEFTRINQYLSVANCVWWIARVTGLDTGLTIHIDYLNSQWRIHHPASQPTRENFIREISSTPRDIARSVSAESVIGDSQGKANLRKPLNHQNKISKRAQKRKCHTKRKS